MTGSQMTGSELLARIAAATRRVFRAPALQPRTAKLLLYHPPDLDMLRLSAQDHSLDPLKLVDKRAEMLLARQKALAKRGKWTRVSLEHGVQKPPADKGSKKKKRK